MRVLVAVTWCSHGKDYVVPKFMEMADHVFVLNPNVDVVFFGDMVPPGPYAHVPVDWGGAFYAEDMLMATREEARKYAIKGGYDILMWHGIDALWQSLTDFSLMVAKVNLRNPVIAPVISARADSRFWIARRFRWNPDEQAYGENQYDISKAEINGHLVRSGFPGADNIAIHRSVFEYVGFEGHTKWYERVAQGRENLCVEEWWCLKAINLGYRIHVDTSTFVWHVHEDGIARMIDGIERDMETLTWK